MHSIFSTNIPLLISNCFNLLKTIFNNNRTALRNALMLDRGKIKMVIVGQSIFFIYKYVFFLNIIPCNKIEITIHIVERYLLKVYLLKWLAIL